MLWSTMGQTRYALEHCGLHWSHSVMVLYSMAVGAWLICSSGVRQIADDGPTQSEQKSGFADAIVRSYVIVGRELKKIEVVNVILYVI